MTYFTHKLLALALMTGAALTGQNTVATGKSSRLLLGPRVEVPETPTAFTTDGQHLWIGYASNAPGATPGLLKVRSSDNAVVSQIGLKSAPTSLCWDGSSLWMADGTALTRRIGNTVFGYVVPGGNPWSLAFDGEYLYVVAGKASTTQLLIYRLIDLGEPLAGTENVVQTPNPHDVISIGGFTARALPMAVSGRNVFVGTDKGVIWLIAPDAAGGRHGRIPLSSAPVQSMVYHKGYAMWITTGVKSLQYAATDRPEIFMGSGTTFNGAKELPFVPTAIGSDGSNLVIGYENGQVDLLESSLRYNLGGAPTSMTFDGSYLWIANSGGSRSRWFLNKM